MLLTKYMQPFVLCYLHIFLQLLGGVRCYLKIIEAIMCFIGVIEVFVLGV